MNVSVLAFIFRRQFSQNQKFHAKLLIFFKLVGEMQQVVRKHSQKNN